MLISQNSTKDKWITIKPHGEDGKGKHILLQDGETPEQAIERLYGKSQKKPKIIKENKLDEETKKWLEEKLYALNKLAKQYRPNIDYKEISDEDGGFIYQKIFDDKNKKQREELYEIKDKILNKYGTPTGKVHKFPVGYGVEYSIEDKGSFHKYYRYANDLKYEINKEAIKKTENKLNKDKNYEYNIYTDGKVEVYSTLEAPEDLPYDYYKDYYYKWEGINSPEDIYSKLLKSSTLSDYSLKEYEEAKIGIKKTKSEKKKQVYQQTIDFVEKKIKENEYLKQNKKQKIKEIEQEINNYNEKLKNYNESDSKAINERKRVIKILKDNGYILKNEEIKANEELPTISAENKRNIEITKEDIKKLKSMVNNQNDKDILPELIAMEESGATKEDIISAIMKIKSKSTKKQLVTNSLLELGEDITDGQKGKGRKFISRFIEAGVAHYQDFGDVLITKETLDRFIHTMVGCPVIIQHKEITDKNADKERVGVVSNVFYSNTDGWYYCEGIIWDKQAIDLVKNQGWNVSCTYDFVSDNQEKTHNGKKIDMEFIDGNFLHLALVPNPRYERANIVINSKEDEVLLTIENESEQDLNDTSVDRWITIKPNGSEAKGRPLLIKAGKTVDEAIKDKFDEWAGNNPKQQKLFDIKEYKKSKEETKKEKAVKPIEPTSPTPKYPNQDRPQQEPKKQGDKKQGESEFERILRETKEKTNRKVKYDDKDTSLTDLIQKGFHPIKFTGSIYKDDHLTYLQKEEKGKLYRLKISEDEYKVLTPLYEAKIKEKFKDVNYGKGITRKSKSSLSIIESKMQRMREDEKAGFYKAKNSIEIKRKDNIFMAVMDELKDFILGVVGNECDKDKGKVENEDKRKIIDEIGGMLKDKVDEELWRTIVGKLEKVAYNPSETDKADNKAKNEDEKDEEKEEKYKEEKEVADVENKCGKAKNSMDKAREIVFGGSQPELKSSYVSREERLKLGDNY